MSIYEDSLVQFNQTKHKTIPHKLNDWGKLLYFLMDFGKYTHHLSNRRLPYIHSQHRVKMSNYLYDMMTIATLENLIDQLDGLIIKPGETFSFWYSTGKPNSDSDLIDFTNKRHPVNDYHVHGTHYVLASILYFSALRTELTIVERKSLEVEFDSIFCTAINILEGADVAVRYPLEDLKIENTSNKVYQLKLRFVAKEIICEWRSLAMPQFTYDLYIERQDVCRNEDKEYYRHNVIYCRINSIRTEERKIQYLMENHKLLLYKPKKLQHIEVGHD